MTFEESKSTSVWKERLSDIAVCSPLGIGLLVIAAKYLHGFYKSFNGINVDYGIIRDQAIVIFIISFVSVFVVSIIIVLCEAEPYDAYEDQDDD